MKILNIFTFLIILFVLGISMSIGGIVLDMNFDLLQDAAVTTGVSEQTGPVFSNLRNVFMFVGGFMIMTSVVGFILMMFTKDQEPVWRG